MNTRLYLRRTRAEHTNENPDHRNDLNPDQGKERQCHACTLPIFSTPFESRRDSDGSRLFLHKCCSKLPTELEHVSHPKGRLILNTSRPVGAELFCSNCGEECEGFFYQCPDWLCRFTLDVSCAVTIKLLHRSHKHELVPIIRRASFTCNACQSQREGLYYFCNLCNFWIHRHCAALPSTIQHKEHDVDQQQHPLSLSYSIPLWSLRFQNVDTCSICHEELYTESGAYFCMRCQYTVHIKCAINDPASFQSVSSGDAVRSLIHLPMANEQMTSMGHLLENSSSSSSSGATDLFKEELHDHPLIKYDEDGLTPSPSESSSSSYLCNACIRPITSPPYYTCPQCPDFFLHTCCANNLPLHLQHPAHRGYPRAGNCKDRPLALIPRCGDGRISAFYCDACYRYCNGFAYGCEGCGFKLDVECAFLPEAIVHEAHRNTHILFLSYSSFYDRTKTCSCCCRPMIDLCYHCCSCPDFGLHAGCALLPATVAHKLDGHPLKLTSSTRLPDEDFCEVCEESMIDTKGWFYHCTECVQSFHIDCIPCVGQYANITFGGEIRVKCHKSCPLTSVRLLTSHSYACGRCNKTIQGKRDDIAFACSKCNYWMHDYCARKELDRP